MRRLFLALAATVLVAAGSFGLASARPVSPPGVFYDSPTEPYSVPGTPIVVHLIDLQPRWNTTIWVGWYPAADPANYQFVPRVQFTNPDDGHYGPVSLGTLPIVAGLPLHPQSIDVEYQQCPVHGNRCFTVRTSLGVAPLVAPAPPTSAGLLPGQVRAF